MDRGIRVRLRTDLTRYNAKLTPGVEGVTVGQYGMWSKGSDRFVGVHFPGIGTLDVLWEGLEIVDEAFLRRAEEAEQQRWEAMKSARNVILVKGPRGGFRHLSYEYTDASGTVVHASTGFREDAEKRLAFFKREGIPVVEEVRQ